MRREFNVTGSCNKDYHYMVDTSAKYEQIYELIQRRKYFVINRPRQYGKTSMLDFIRCNLLKRKDDYILSQLSFEGVGDTMFENENSFSPLFLELLAESLEMEYPELVDSVVQASREVSDFKSLSRFITQFIKSRKRNFVLLIDEVDKSSNSQTFLSFLGMLRTKYLKTSSGIDFTFHSIVLAGVHDIKSLKLKIREGNETKLNSPWNIAADFNVDMSFSVSEIKTLLEDYRSENEVQMDVAAIAERLFYYTNGYPFLVSKLCKNIDEEAVGNCAVFDPSCWSVEDVDWSFKWLSREDYTTTHFDDLVKNLENNPDLYALVESILFQGIDQSVSFSVKNPLVNLGALYGILGERGGRAVIHNRVYEQILSDYFRSKKETSAKAINFGGYLLGYVGESGSLDVRRVLSKFQEFMREHYCDRDAEFIEREGRLIFMSFLKPIINGKGFMWKEPVVADERRMDLVVSYGSKQKEVIELKLWRGPQYHEKGLKQLSDYLDFQGLSQGYLLIFDFTKNKSYKQEELSIEGKSVFAVWV